MKLRPLPLLLPLLALGAVLAAGAQRQRTTRPLKPHAPLASAAASLTDTLELDAEAVAFHNYDKPLRAARETVFATNLTPDTLRSLRLRIRYRTTAGDQAHEAVVWVPAELPPGQTRLLSWPAWDLNGSFYYRHSRPSRTPGTPYDITLRALQATVRGR